MWLVKNREIFNCRQKISVHFIQKNIHIKNDKSKVARAFLAITWDWCLADTDG